MLYRELGNTNVKLSVVGLGAWPLSEVGRPSEAQAIEVIQSSINTGVNFIDTANAYCLDDSETGHNERLIRKALSDNGFTPSHKLYIATKGGCIRPDGQWRVNGKKQALIDACEKSLEDLGQEQIFLYQLHAPDSTCSFEESIEALAELKSRGLVAHVGLSNVDIRQLNEAQSITRIESVQNKLNLYFSRDIANGFVQQCYEQSVSYIAYSPVGGSFHHQRMSNEKAIQELAQKYQVSSYQVMLSWLIHHSENLFVIPGSTRVASAVDSPKAAELKLSTEDLAMLSDFAMNYELA
ncbi:MAG: aldo/keto reductase [Chlamydiales bacterium]|nr:aldo/keto reductase [Chlamydiales bacterium]